MEYSLVVESYYSNQEKDTCGRMRTGCGEQGTQEGVVLFNPQKGEQGVAVLKKRQGER